MKKYWLIAIAVICLAGSWLVAVHHPAAKHTAASPAGLYVALGDSVAAGDGLETDSDSSACNRTDEGYPHLVARALNYKLADITCSGATVPQGITGVQNVNGLAVPAQLSQMRRGPRPDVISLTIGANDAGWTQPLLKCYSGECGSAADTAGADERLAQAGVHVHQALSAIHQAYPKSPRIILTGYYQFFPSQAMRCNDLVGIDANELAWGRQQQVKLNDAIRQAAAGFSSVTFVEPDFSGHELCTPDSWVQGLADTQPYHPTDAGQAAYAKAIVTALRAKQ